MTSRAMKAIVIRSYPCYIIQNWLELLKWILQKREFFTKSSLTTDISSSSTRHLDETESKAGTIKSNNLKWIAIETDYILNGHMLPLNYANICTALLLEILQMYGLCKHI